MTAPKRSPGRPPAAPEDRRAARFELRLTAAQRDKLERLGGAEWLRRRIDCAKEPVVLVRVCDSQKIGSNMTG